MTDLRKELVKSCRAYLQQKMDVVKKAMEGLKDDLENESKSSAGDKFETGREMINIEWNKLSTQLNQYDHLNQTLKRIDEHKPTKKVVLGSVVRTDAASYFISIPAGEIKTENDKFYAVGIQAPIAQKLLGKEVGDQIDMNGKAFRILNII